MLSIAIQAGGQSSRMGVDKALLPFLGQPLITRLVTRLAPIGDELFIITNRPDDYAFLGLSLYPDAIPNRGALGGLYTALHAASQPKVAVVACDMPFVSPELLRLQSALMDDEAADVVIPKTEQGYEPLHAVYRRETCIPAVRTSIQAGQWKMIAWFEHARVRTISAEDFRQYDPHGLTFANVNTPSEFARAEKLAQEFD